MSGKRAFLELLKQEGVEILFGNPGTTELPLMDALATESELRYVLALQEAAVVAMADGYAQASGRLTVVNLHVAPGLGNGMGMLYDAQKAGAPILVTAGQHDQGFNVTEPILWADLPTLIAGDAVAQSRAHAELVELAELLGAPVFAEAIANTASFPASHPLFRGGMVRLAPSIRKRLEEHDVLFSVGGDLFTLSLPSWVEPVPKDLKIVHLDIDPWELGKNDPA